ncbi:MULTISPECIES: flagellar basal body-associated FliL family protein [unclassified Methylobacterium]|uniref:flagellar basal body-associated FliL family protein n=1 Tax=unclassified Methylobacterium TaxID=2615210 RepID=UPI0007004285|nr:MULTISPECIES: flagellar basal body-associated FliL family protein [unclassified Methylobacterium]KQP82691.1 flagellar basal body protein FliL [Methylobacterium sp. Leaf117]KQP93168.1 flagellar basal body protein FliL [Methylobacterium sp. Leaf113]MCK2053199.1 flagellar basal body-associated FliL family protein [Methylobacterium sp. 37f]
MAAKADDKTDAKAGGGKGWIAALALTSLVAIGTGGGLGMYLLSTVEKAVDVKKKDEEDKAVKVLKYTGDVALRSVGSVVTSLADTTEAWIRLESSVVFKTGAVPNPDLALAEIRSDIVAYLRTVTTKQIEGPSGLLHLREDLNERVALRTKGQVRELIVETLVVQ